MRTNRSSLWLVLCWVWVVIVGAYAVWGTMNESGLAGWLIALQAERFGGYYPKATAALILIVLAGPALTYIRWRTQIARALDPDQGPAGDARRAARVARQLLAGGIVLVLVGAGAWLLSQRMPDGSAAAVPFDAATLGSGAPPAGKVRISGAVDPDAATAIEEGGPGGSVIVYAGFRADADPAKDAPHRLFVQRRAGGNNDVITDQVFLPEQEGYLVENGLPELALQDLQARGTRIASPHYLLRSAAPGVTRDTYYIVAGLGGFTGIACILLGLIGLIQARIKLRRAEFA